MDNFTNGVTATDGIPQIFETYFNLTNKDTRERGRADALVLRDILDGGKLPTNREIKYDPRTDTLRIQVLGKYDREYAMGFSENILHDPLAKHCHFTWESQFRWRGDKKTEVYFTLVHNFRQAS